MTDIIAQCAMCQSNDQTFVARYIFHTKEKLQKIIQNRKSYGQAAVLKKHLLTHNGDKCKTSICEHCKLRKHPFNPHQREIA